MQYPSSSLLPDWLTRAAENHPAQLAIQAGNQRWTFAELAEQAHHLAGQLTTLGITAQSRVALLANNSLAYVAMVHALTQLEAILIPLNTRLTRQELTWQLADVRAVLLVSDPGMQARANELIAEQPELPLALLQTVATGPTGCQIHLHAPGAAPYQETDVAARTLLDLQATQVIMYTSGTTGHPKGVTITYGMQWWNALGSALNLGYHADDCWLACLPLFHIGGLSLLMKNVIYGMRIVLHERFEEQAINRAIQKEGITIISVVAVMLQRMLNDLTREDTQARYPDSLRCVLLGGGPAPLPLLEECARLHIPVTQTYGLTEACSQAVTLAPADALRKIGSAGRPLLPVQMQIRDGEHALQANQVGVIYLQGPTITPGYTDRPESTAAAFHNGWFCTGDLGYLDEEGYLYVLDRRSDLIISGGENIYPAEIESVLLTHPEVAEAGVCGRSDPQWGQVPIAFVRLHPHSQSTPEAILQAIAGHLARYKMPRALYIVAELPRNSSGKLLRRELLALLPTQSE